MTTLATANPPPVPGDPTEMRRVAETRRRRAMLYGEHGPYVTARIRASVGHIRSDAWGEPDLSSCAFTSSSTALATLYDPTDEGESSPTVACSVDTEAAAQFAQVLDAGGIWPAMSRIQRDTIALREMFVRIDSVIEPDGVRLQYRPVAPDLVEAVPDPRDPTRPIELREWRQRGDKWTREVWSIKGTPRHQITDSEGNDISDRWGLPAGGLTGELYPALRQDGRAVLPYVLHHAALGTGALFDPFYGIEIVEGSLQCCLYWTFYGHVLRSSAWSDRYTIGAELAGTIVGANGVTTTVADPAVVQHLRKMEDFDGQPIAGQWAQTVDPMQVAESIAVYERRLHSAAGLDPSDVQRTSGDPRSGYSFEISKKSKEHSALRFAPVFARADAEMVTTSAVLFNRAANANVWPESGWSVEHAPIRAIRARALAAGPGPLAGVQQAEMRATVAAVCKGEISRAGASAMLRRSFQIDEAQADELLAGSEEIAALNRLANIATKKP